MCPDPRQIRKRRLPPRSHNFLKLLISGILDDTHHCPRYTQVATPGVDGDVLGTAFIFLSQRLGESTATAPNGQIGADCEDIDKLAKPAHN